MSDESAAQWYAVHAKPRSEELAEAHLQRQGFRIYLPRIRFSKRRRGRWTQVTEPLFPRYLFVYVDPNTEGIAPIRSTRGVTGLVRFGDVPMPVPDDAIEAIRAMEDPEEGVYIPGRAQLQKGEKVRVVEGAFAGLQGIYQAESGEERAIILIDILGRQSRVRIETNGLEKAT